MSKYCVTLNYFLILTYQKKLCKESQSHEHDGKGKEINLSVHPLEADQTLQPSEGAGVR